MSKDESQEPESAEVTESDEDAIEVDEFLFEALVPTDEVPPQNLLVYPLNAPGLFPGMTVPLIVEGEHGQRIVEQAAAQSSFVGFLARREPTEEVGDAAEASADEVYTLGVAGRLLRAMPMPDGSVAALVAATHRFEVERWLRHEPFLIARVSYPDQTYGEPDRTAAMLRQTQATVVSLVDMIPNIPDQFAQVITALTDPARLADVVAGHFPMEPDEKQALLEELDATDRLEQVLTHLIKELELRKLGQRIQEELQAKIEKQQKEFMLREQLKAIRKELGEEVDSKDADVARYKERLGELELPADTHKRAQEELRRLEQLSTESPEYNIVRTYLDWLTSLPWNALSEDNFDLERAEKILDDEHYGLEEIKERIIEALAVRKLRKDARAPVLCFVGPPGVGKTSLGKSIAKALGREFYRFSLGGMRDEAELKGHRRTYVGAMPGKILQGLKRAGTRNPVFVLDEIDKLGSDWRGDPASAMLEILDPAQNHGYLDHYLDVPFDLTQVMFIATANVREQIPGPLLDRMEVIHLSGYIEDEKVEIAARHLLPRQREHAGVTPGQLQIPRPVLRSIVSGWTREAGVRELDRQIGKVTRKAGAALARDREFAPRMSKARLPELLGPPSRERDKLGRIRRPGTALGLAWTPVGGEVLVIETAAMRGKGGVTLTGQLGDVMTESARIAFNYLRSRADDFGIEHETLEKTDVHVHFPAGAIPKDGPSAGITITTALLSLLAPGQPKVESYLAMTGEITLSGKVLPVGGIREKVIGARLAGVKKVLLPAANEKDLANLPDHLLEGLTVELVESYDEVLEHAFATSPRVKGSKRRSSSRWNSSEAANAAKGR